MKPLSWDEARTRPGTYHFIVAKSGRRTNDKAVLTVTSDGTFINTDYGISQKLPANRWSGGGSRLWTFAPVGGSSSPRRKLLLLEKQ